MIKNIHGAVVDIFLLLVIDLPRKLCYNITIDVTDDSKTWQTDEANGVLIYTQTKKEDRI